VHEMSVTQSMLDMALQYAEGRRITAINLAVGEMSTVVPDSVSLYFEFLSKGTPAEGAALHFEVEPMVIICQSCGAVADLSEWAGERPAYILTKALERGCGCGSHNLRVTEGANFTMTSLEVEES
jgi:hydrogenase nickel incorporation protein HypA/HybF